MRERLEAAEPVAEQGAPDARGFEDFFEAEHGRLYGTLCLITANAAEGQEIMQEAFLRLWERWDRIREHPDPPGYLYRTAFSVLRNRYRRALRAAQRVVVPREAPDPFVAVEEREVLLQALRRLSPRQRAAVVLTELMDMSSDEAAEVLEVKPVTVRVLASQGRAALRAALGAGDE
jgi:RNA polymerase sigma-70 factor (ECF subfamily)